MRPDIYRATLKRVKFLRYRKPESLLEQLGTIPGSYTFLPRWMAAAINRQED